MSDETQHARLGPSNARWVHCPGSIREEERYPDVAGEAAIDGTGSHLLLEMCMENNVPAAQYDQQIIGANHPDNMNGWLVAPDRIERVQMALDYITRRVAELKAQFPGCSVLVESEQKVDPGGAFGRDDWWGTCDISIIARDSMTGEVYFVEAADYKDGRGYVTEKNNSQLISYLFGKMRKYVTTGPDQCRPFKMGTVNGCRMTIIQPKTNPVIRYQCSTRSEDGISPATVISAAADLAIAAAKTDDADAELHHGKHCQWCKANPKRGGHCNAETNQSLQTVETMTTEIATTGDDSLLDHISQAVSDPKSLSVDVLSKLASAEAGFQAAFDKVKAEIQERIESGVSVPGYAMVPGNGANKWNVDEETLVKKLKSRRLKNSDIYPAKLITPAACLKLPNLTDDQKKRIEKDLISFVASDKKSLKQVAHDHQSEKVVAQSSTDDVQSTEVELMFADVPKQETEAPAAEVSFF